MPAPAWIRHAVVMINDAVTAVRDAVDAINDRSLGGPPVLDVMFLRFP